MPAGTATGGDLPSMIEAHRFAAGAAAYTLGEDDSVHLERHVARMLLYETLTSCSQLFMTVTILIQLFGIAARRFVGASSVRSATANVLLPLLTAQWLWLPSPWSWPFGSDDGREVPPPIDGWMTRFYFCYLTYETLFVTLMPLVYAKLRAQFHPWDWDGMMERWQRAVGLSTTLRGRRLRSLFFQLVGTVGVVTPFLGSGLHVWALWRGVVPWWFRPDVAVHVAWTTVQYAVLASALLCLLVSLQVAPWIESRMTAERAMLSMDTSMRRGGGFTGTHAELLAEQARRASSAPSPLQPGHPPAAVVVLRVDETCSVCCSTYVSTDRCASIAPCGHTFHETCLRDWLQSGNNPACPLCGTRVV